MCDSGIVRLDWADFLAHVKTAIWAEEFELYEMYILLDYVDFLMQRAHIDRELNYWTIVDARLLGSNANQLVGD